MSSSALPWHYLPVWIAISTPLLVLAGFLVGVPSGIQSTAGTLVKAVKTGRKGFAQALSHPDVLGWFAVAAWLVIPVAAIYWFHSVLYNGWRQMFFIYPPIVIFAVHGLRTLHDWARQQARPAWTRTVTAVAILILAAGLAEPISFLLRYPIYGYVYFNGLAGDPATLRQRFEQDYWGLSYKQAIDHILATDPRDAIRIYVADTPGLNYIYAGLPALQEARLAIAQNQDDNIDYFVGDFSFHPGDYFPAESESFSINVRGVKIIVVYRFR